MGTLKDNILSNEGFSLIQCPEREMNDSFEEGLVQQSDVKAMNSASSSCSLTLTFSELQSWQKVS